MRTYTVLIALSVVTAALSGCVGTRPGHGTVAIATLPPAPDTSASPTPWALDIANSRGSVTVQVDPDTTQPVVLAETPGVKDASDPARSVAAEAVLDGSTHLLRVAAAASEGANLPVYLKITIPASNGVHIRSAGGPVTLTGVAGAIDIESGGAAGVGSPIYILTDAALTQGIRAITSQGNIKIRMGKASTGLLEVHGNHASVTPPAGVQLTNIRQDGTTFAAHIGEGESHIEVKASNGAADVRFDQGEVQKQATTKSGQSNAVAKRKKM